jgi:hypothetical protein
MFGDDEAIRSDSDLAEDYADAAVNERLITSLQKDVAAKQAEIVRLREYVRSQALCPYCDEYERCVDGCTFHEDNDVDWEAMEAARAVLRRDDSPILLEVDEPEDDDLGPVYCHRCGDYCSEPRVQVGNEWLCPACAGPVCHACGERSPDCIDRDGVPVCPSCAEPDQDYTGPVCKKCRKQVSAMNATQGFNDWLCDSCAAAAEHEWDRRREERE